MTNYKVLQIKLSYPNFIGNLRTSIISILSDWREVSKLQLLGQKISANLKIKNLFSNKKFVKGLILSVLAILLVSGGVSAIKRFGGKGSNGKIEVKGATATQEIGKEFAFPLRLANGDEVGNVKYLIERGELRDEIIVKGQRATAVSGRTFLIFTLKISNEYKQAIEINTKDYMRLSVNGNRKEWLAPDIHNDPVAVQAISTKFTRVGFPINETDKDLILRVGEIDGKKVEIPLVFN